LEAGIEPLAHYTSYGEMEKRGPLHTANIAPESKTPSNTITFQTISVLSKQPVPSIQPGISNPKICFHFPASPTDAFFSQIAMFKLSLDALGGSYKDADTIITLGDEQIKLIPDQWKFLLEKNIIINWAAPEDFLRKKYDAQGDAQWIYNHEKYDFVCILDADVLIMRPIDDLLTNMLQNPAITGTIAHYPIPTNTGENPQYLWQKLANHFIGKPIDFEYRHTLVEGQPMDSTFCPFYVNFGFILISPKIIQDLRETYLDIRKKVSPFLKYPYFSAQVALTLAVAAHQIPTRAVGLRYNFPNDSKADHLHLNELTDVRLIHYLRTEYFDRHKIFTSQPEFEHFLSLKLTGSNKIFQDYINNLTDGRYPFPNKL
jgi:hypothetical protein